MAILSALSEIPLEEGIDALITEFGKIIGKIIEHSFIPCWHYSRSKIPWSNFSLRMT